MLIFLLQDGYTEVVELLLRTPGIDVNAATIEGQTPLHLTARVSIISIAMIIINLFSIPLYITYMNCFMLIFILQEGHTEVVELLLRTPGIDVNAVNTLGYTPLDSADGVSDHNNHKS